MLLLPFSATCRRSTNAQELEKLGRNNPRLASATGMPTDSSQHLRHPGETLAFRTVPVLQTHGAEQCPLEGRPRAPIDHIKLHNTQRKLRRSAQYSATQVRINSAQYLQSPWGNQSSSRGRHQRSRSPSKMLSRRQQTNSRKPQIGKRKQAESKYINGWNGDSRHVICQHYV